MKFLLLDKRLQLNLNANDVLKTDTTHMSIMMDGVKGNFNQYYDSRYLRLSLSYTFGRNNLKTTQRTSGNQEEQNRAN